MTDAREALSHGRGVAPREGRRLLGQGRLEDLAAGGPPRPGYGVLHSGGFPAMEAMGSSKAASWPRERSGADVRRIRCAAATAAGSSGAWCLWRRHGARPAPRGAGPCLARGRRQTRSAAGAGRPFPLSVHRQESTQTSRPVPAGPVLREPPLGRRVRVGPVVQRGWCCGRSRAPRDRPAPADAGSEAVAEAGVGADLDAVADVCVEAMAAANMAEAVIEVVAEEVAEVVVEVVAEEA